MKNEKGHYLFSINDEHYLYDYVGNIIIELSSYLYNSLKKYDANGKCDNKERAVIKAFIENGLLHNVEKELNANSLDEKIAYLSFAPAYRCNFRCRYCFAEYGNYFNGGKREFTKELVVDMLDFFLLSAYPNAEKYRIDFVSGGEPLLGMNIIKTAVDYLEKYSLSSGKQISMWLCTNGALLTDEIIEYLSLHNVSIGISLDGRKEYNDAVRIDSNGHGTYDNICKGISLIKNSKTVSKKFKTIWGLCTATNRNCDFVDILKHMNEIGFLNVQIRLIRSKEKYDVQKFICQYNRLVEQLIAMYKQGDFTYFRMILNDNDQFGKVLKRILLDHILVRRCNAGVNKITICPDGSIYPCDSLINIPDTCLGNINNSNWNKDVYRNMTVNNIPKCKNCEIKYLCGGDCFYNSYMKSGCQFNPDIEFCEIQRHLVNLAIMLRYKMQKIDEDMYESFVKEVKIKNDYTELFG